MKQSNDRWFETTWRPCIIIVMNFELTRVYVTFIYYVNLDVQCKHSIVVISGKQNIHFKTFWVPIWIHEVFTVRKFRHHHATAFILLLCSCCNIYVHISCVAESGHVLMHINVLHLNSHLNVLERLVNLPQLIWLWRQASVYQFKLISLAPWHICPSSFKLGSVIW